MKYVIMNGDLGSGFDIIGPFDSFEEAADYDTDVLKGGNWIQELALVPKT